MLQIMREPLVHFIVLAGLVFAIWPLFQARQTDTDRTIVLTGEVIERMAGLYAVEAGTPPSDAEIRAIVADHVRETALAREARRLGLDEGDTIIERRLSQKMAFLLSDRDAPPVPDEQTLRAFYADRAGAYETPARVTFQHVFFTGGDADREADLRQQLETASQEAWRTIGDATMVRLDWGDVPAREVTRQFGPEFTSALMALEPDPSWQGPMLSAFGAHFIRLQARSAATTLPFESVRADVGADWLDQWRQDQNARAIETVVSRYRVEIGD
ncbi:MAG: peptidylprolyl isomerase [Pseudomonadota bacterium]